MEELKPKYNILSDSSIQDFNENCFETNRSQSKKFNNNKPPDLITFDESPI